MIFAPMIGYKRNGEADRSQQSDARTDKPEPRLVGFVLCTCSCWPDRRRGIARTRSTFQGRSGRQAEQVGRVTTGQGIKLEFSDKIAPARGMSYGGLIRILPDMEPSETLATFVHELAHEMLHRAERPHSHNQDCAGNRSRGCGVCGLPCFGA